MLKLEDFETIFLLTSFAGALIISSPALAFVFPSQTSEKFTELYVLGSNRMAEDYPFNVKAGEGYKIYLGIGNHMGSSVHYALYVKLRNQTEPLPNSTTGAPNPLPPLYEYRVFLGHGEVWETPLDFSFEGFSFYGNSSILETLTVNGLNLHVDKTTSWDSENKGYYFELFFELWIHDPESNGFSSHNRFVGIWLSITA